MFSCVQCFDETGWTFDEIPLRNHSEQPQTMSRASIRLHHSSRDRISTSLTAILCSHHICMYNPALRLRTTLMSYPYLVYSLDAALVISHYATMLRCCPIETIYKCLVSDNPAPSPDSPSKFHSAQYSKSSTSHPLAITLSKLRSPCSALGTRGRETTRRLTFLTQIPS